jgi:hypothetical protein
MFRNKKEDDEKLPDLPQLPRASGLGSGLRKLDEHTSDDLGDDEAHPLPAFPDTPGHNVFSNAAIKGAVGGRDEGIPDYPDEDEKIKTIEMEEWSPESREYGGELPRESFQESMSLKPGPISMEPLSRTGGPARDLTKEITSQSPDVFIKIDKFRSAKKALIDVKAKLADIDQLIHKIREVKMREEQELVSWERDMEQIKSRIKSVTENIFEKV